MKKIFLLCFVVFQTFVVASAFSEDIYIKNYSFEDPQHVENDGWGATATGAWTQGLGIPDWVTSDAEYSGVITGYGTATDGNNAAWIQGKNYIAQTLGVTLQANYDYTLTLSLGHRSDLDLAPEIQFLAGTATLLDNIPTIPEAGENSTITLHYLSGQNVAPDQYLQIILMNNQSEFLGVQSNFDNIRLDGSLHSTPEPVSMVLFGIGGLALGVFRKIKKSKV
jgi:hypothetical protein